jgi:hypothetical protein
MKSTGLLVSSVVHFGDIWRGMISEYAGMKQTKEHIQRYCLAVTSTRFSLF